MNIFGYLEKFGNKSFAKMKFKETDSLVFSQLAYLKFEKVFDSLAKGKKYIPLTDFLSLPDQGVLYDETNNPVLYGELWDRVVSSKRYSKMKIGYVRVAFDEKTDLQFMALTLKYGFHKYIVFRGTDGTLTGWKEDCNMAILDEIPAQAEAVKYVNEVVSWSIFPFSIIGHSKGGNLADYAALKMKEKYVRRIKGVYNHDGPGFDKPELFDEKIIKKLEKKFHKVVPGESVIGMLLHQLHGYKVVLSEKATFFQHSVLKWELNEETGNLIELEDRTPASKAWEKDIKTMIASTSHDDRVLLVNTLFEILRWDGRTTIYEVTKLTKMDFAKIGVKALFKYDRKTSAFLVKNLWEFYRLRVASREELEPKGKRKHAKKRKEKESKDTK